MQNILDNIDLSFIFRNQMPVNIIWIKYILKDNVSVVIKRPQKQSILHLMLMSRGYLPNSPYTCNIRIPIETGRWQTINTRENRKCTKCSKDVIGDEYHYLFIRVITKLPNSEQSNKGKVKTHKYINRQNQSPTGKL
jgi:hypothetical protein